MKGKSKPFKNQPSKNHIPDVSNSNKLKNTTLDFKQFQKSIKKQRKKQSNQQNYESLKQLSQNIYNTGEVYSQYQFIFEQYQKVQQENQTLHTQVAHLNEEINRYKNQSNRVNKDGQLNHYSSKTDNENVRQKLISLFDEKKQLQKELQKERSKNDQNLKNIQALRQELFKHQYNLKKLKGNSMKQRDKFNDLEMINDIQGRFTIFSNEIIKNYQNKMNQVLEDINLKINKLEMQQKFIKQQASRILTESKYLQKTPNSQKNTTRNKNFVSKRQNDQKDVQTAHRQESVLYPLSISPHKKTKIEIKNFKYSDDLDQISQEMSIQKKQRSSNFKQFSQTIIHEQTQSSAQQLSEIILQKQKIISQLRQKLQTNLYQLKKQSQIKYYNKNHEYNILQRKYKDLQQKIKSKQKQIKQLNDLIDSFTRRYNNEVSLNSSRQINQKENLLEKNSRLNYENKDQSIEIFYEKQFKKMRIKYQHMVTQMKNCISIIGQLKKLISSKQNTKILEKNQKYVETILQSSIASINQQRKQDLDFETKLLLKDQIILQHETVNCKLMNELQASKNQIKQIKNQSRIHQGNSDNTKQKFIQKNQISIKILRENKIKMQSNNNEVMQKLRFLQNKENLLEVYKSKN